MNESNEDKKIKASPSKPAPELTPAISPAEAKRQAEAYADSIVQAQADGNHNDYNNENVEAYPTIYKNRRVLNELDEMLNDLSKDVSSGVEWKAKARAVRFERRLNERYGILRPILFHPTLQPYIRNIQRKYALGHFSLVRQGDGPLSLSSSMILLFMLQRNKVSTPNIILTGLFLVVGLKPWVLVLAVCIGRFMLLRRWKERPKGMTYHQPQNVRPYFNYEHGSDEKSQRKAANECLKQPVGTPIEKLKGLFDSDTSFDTILLGTGPGPLYCAALLSRIGKKVLVLSADSDASGCLMQKYATTKKWKDCNVPFDASDSKVGRVSQQQKLLAPALCNDIDLQGGVRFVPIGSEANGYAYDIITVSEMGKGPDDSYDIPFILRSGGTKALADDACTYLGDAWMEADSFTASYMNSCSALNSDSSKFYISKLIPAWSKALNQDTGDSYKDAACRFAGDFITALAPQTPNASHVKSLLSAIGLRSENLPPCKTSMGVHISNCGTASSPDGYHYVVGGPRSLCHALRSTIQSCGGMVATSVKDKSLVFEESDKGSKDAPACVGLELSDGSTISCMDVVSSIGFLPTFLQLVPQSVRDDYGIPSGVPSLTEKRPLMKFLIGINGDADELELPSADWWRLPSANNFKENSDDVIETEQKDNDELESKKKEKVKFDAGKSWINISFPSAKDPSWKERYPGMTTCVVTIEADDDFATLIDSKPAIYLPKKIDEGDVSRLTARIMHDVLDIFPQLEGKIGSQELRGPVRAGLSHSPQRYAAEGIRPETLYPGLFMSGNDLTLDGFSGSTVAAWLAANAVVGYSAIDHLVLQKNISSDLQQFLKEPDFAVSALPFEKTETVEESNNFEKDIKDLENDNSDLHLKEE